MAENSLVWLLNDDISYLETLIENQRNEPYFYFKVKIIVNKNNSLSLADKVIGIGKSHVFIFWAEESQPTKHQGLNSSKKQEINFDLLQFPQQKIPLTKFDQFSLIPSTDSQFTPYLKSIIPSFSTEQYPNICESFSLLFLKSTQQYETQSILCPKYSTGLQMLYVFQMMKSIKSYEESLEKNQSSSGNKPLLIEKGNLKLMRMMCNLKFAFIDADPQNFGFNSQTNYQEIQEKREMLLYEQALQEIMKKSHYQFANPFNLKIYFKIIDENSKTYATNFILPIKDKLEILQLSGCQVTDQIFKSLMLEVKKQSLKGSPFLDRSLSERLHFSVLKHLNLSGNKLTDQIFDVFCRLIYPQKEKVSENGNNQSSNSIKPLFPALISVNLSKNNISLQSEGSEQNFIDLVQNLSSFVLKIDMSYNKVSSLQLFEKYFVQADLQAISSLPIEFIDLRGNSGIGQSIKESFISNYLEKHRQLSEKFMADIGFIVDLGEISCTHDKNSVKYLVLLENYLESQKETNFFEEVNCFGTHFKKLMCQYDSSQSKSSLISKKNAPLNQINSQKRQITLILSKQLEPLQRTLQFTSSIRSIRNSQLKSPKNSKNLEFEGKILEDFSKVFYLKDYKMLSLMKNELIHSLKVNSEELQKTFAQQLDQKRAQQKRIISLIEKVVNFIDIKEKDGINTLDEQRSINQKLDKLVGIIRRKGIQGQGSQFVVYLKHLRDLLIQSYLATNQVFSTINPIYDHLKNIKTNYTTLYSQAIKQKSNFLNVDYLHLANCPIEEIQKMFLDNKNLGLIKMNESVYDRLKYLLMEKVTFTRILHLSETLIQELKLFPTKVVRDYAKITGQDTQLKPFLRAKQRLTSKKLGSISNRMQHLRLYSIVHYPFNNKITQQISRSTYEGIMSCMNFPQARQQQTLSFIEVVNNFMAFLFYTPEIISQQTVTYINYIVNYLTEISLQTFDDLEWKECLIEEFYLHLMNFKPEQKLIKGLLLNVFEYFTSRLICRHGMEKYILAYLLENQTSSLEQSHLILNNLASSGQSMRSLQPQSLRHLEKRETKISWIIPNQFLLNSFLNQGKLTIHVRFDIPLLQNEASTSLYEVQLFVHETTTIEELVDILFDPNNLYRQHIPLTKKDTLSNKQKLQLLQNCWLFEKVNKFNKLQYFQPYESYRYIGEIVSEKFENEPKIVFYLRKTTIDSHFHNEAYLSEEGNDKQLLELFFKMISNLSISLQLISKLPRNMIISSFGSLNFDRQIEFTSTNYLLVVFARIIYILYSYQLRTMKFQRKSYEYDEEQIEQQKQKLLQRTIQMILDGKPNQFNEKVIVNCKNFTIQEKISIRSQVKDLIQNDNEHKLQLKEKIAFLIRSLGELGFCQTLISGSQIFIINNRFIIEGKLLEHTNESNQIVNVYSKLENIIFFNQIVDLKFQFEQGTQSPNLSIKTLAFNDESKQMDVKEKEIRGSPNFMFFLYNQIIATCRNILHFETELLYQIQQGGIGNTKNFKSSSSMNPSLKTRQKILHYIPQKFITFNITRNKQNESYQRISIQNSKNVIFKVQSQSYQNQKVFQKQVDNSNQEIQVYSRKSSKRSLKSVSSKKELKRQNTSKISNHIKDEHEKEEISSLIPSRKSIYLQNNSTQQIGQLSNENFPSISQSVRHENELKTQDIIKSLNSEENHYKPSEKPAQSHEDVTVITNQQRKSRKQMPKRRSSREKDK